MYLFHLEMRLLFFLKIVLVVCFEKFLCMLYFLALYSPMHLLPNNLKRIYLENPALWEQLFLPLAVPVFVSTPEVFLIFLFLRLLWRLHPALHSVLYRCLLLLQCLCTDLSLFLFVFFLFPP